MNNPFFSKSFTSIWLKHFNKGQKSFHFSLFKKLGFIKHKIPNLYVNLGKTNTKGVHYQLNLKTEIKLKKETFLIYDVPSFNQSTGNLQKPLKRFRVKQYPGYVIELDNYSTLEAYMASVFKGKSRYKLRSYKKRLETNFDVSYKMFFGDITKERYKLLFEDFYKILIKRYDDKKIANNNLEPHEWSFYREITYPMILEKTASLFVVFANEKPIGIMLNFMSEKHVRIAITGFDIDYRQFNVGTVQIMALVQWSLANKFLLIDFSKGHYDYKKRWGSTQYDFEYHIIYNSKSISSSFLAYTLKHFFSFKQYLRNKSINEKLHRFTYCLKSTLTPKKV